MKLFGRAVGGKQKEDGLRGSFVGCEVVLPFPNGIAGVFSVVVMEILFRSEQNVIEVGKRRKLLLEVLDNS